MIFSDFTTDVLELIGVASPGQSISNDEAMRVMRVFNRLIETWRIERQLVYTVEKASHTLTANRNPHTIGASGTAHLTAARPTRITEANLVIGTQRRPMNIMENAEEWARISYPGNTGDPAYLYCDYAMPDANIYLYPVPDSARTIELWTWNQLSKASDLTTTLTFPDGYEHALLYNTAVLACDTFQRKVTDRILDEARKGRVAIKSINSRPYLSGTLDTGIPRSQAY
jgi:hypothetical protein